MRTFRDLLCLVFGLVLLAFVTATADAQGVIVPGPCTRCPDGPRPVTLPRALPVKSITIDTKISAQVATTHVEQVFRNDTDATLEGTYFFPVPESASVSSSPSGTARAVSSARCGRAKRRDASTTRSCVGNAIRDCSNTRARTSFKRASFRSRHTRTKNLS